MDADFPTPTYIRGHEAVLGAYGYWPSFHDAPLLSLERSTLDSRIDLLVHTFEMREGESGFFDLIKNHVVHFRFYDVLDFHLWQFDVPNTLFEMIFSRPSDYDAAGRFEVDLESVAGGDCRASFSAVSGEVISVKLCDRPAAAPPRG